MRKYVAVVAILLLLVGGFSAWYLSRKGSTHRYIDYRGLVLSRMAGMNCYTYSGNSTVTVNNESETTPIEAGMNGSVYFFHGKKSGMEWWAVLRNGTLREKILKGGKTSYTEFNLTHDEIEGLLLYNPIKVGIRALGSSSSVKVFKNTILANYTIYTTYTGESVLLTGNIEVIFDDDYRPTEIHLVEDIQQGDKLLKRIELSVKVNASCDIPKWVREVWERGGG